MQTKLIAATFGLAIMLNQGVSAAESALVLQLSTTGDFERRSITYDCGLEAPVQVTYLNAAPNFLALIIPPEQTEALVFAAVLSASGARYTASNWIWWSKGPDASLFDVTLGEDAEAVLTCSEFNNTP